ncbi:unnamed protein product [Leptosia nina]|uniref:Uncharacterized protein n=1 Tax=Leptosia nina TaxID=320188 RepID=A0AAV1JJK5_9NEOP
MWKIIFFSNFICLVVFAQQINEYQEYVKLPESRLPSSLEINAECIKETGASCDALQRFTKFELDRNNVADRVYGYCYLIKMGFIDQNGYLIKEAVKDLARDNKHIDEVGNVIDACNAENTLTNTISAMFGILDCFKKNSPIHFTSYNMVQVDCKTCNK